MTRAKRALWSAQSFSLLALSQAGRDSHSVALAAQLSDVIASSSFEYEKEILIFDFNFS
jgi:hypothetical protein